MTSNPGDASEGTGGPGDLEGRGLFDGFDSIEVDTARVRIAGAVGGAGSAVLLLHGFPETHAAWHKVAPLLAEHHTVVAPDLPGYGRSLLIDDGAWDKRDVAAELVLLMRRLGHERFHVVGHDRGARVGYRLALDYPGQVSSFSSLAVVPILDVRPAVDWAFAKAAFHWFLLLQSSELVEKLLGADPDTFLDAMLIGMAGSLDTLHPVALADYRAAFRRPEVRAAMIKDYRASDTSDFANDAADRAAGRKIACPVLVFWADERLVAESAENVAITARAVWSRWADEVCAVTVSCGHLIPEHAATEVVRAVLPFLEAATARDLVAKPETSRPKGPNRHGEVR
jgi:haloacetate dehalogenase